METKIELYNGIRAISVEHITLKQSTLRILIARNIIKIVRRASAGVPALVSYDSLPDYLKK